MVVRKSHLYAVIAAVALAALYYFAQAQQDRAASFIREQAINLCVSNLERHAITAHGFKVLASGNPGDKEAVANYRAIGDSIISTFPGVAKQDGRVERIEAFEGEVRYDLPAATAELHLKGCQEAYSGR